jgi:hypothetical protein
MLSKETLKEIVVFNENFITKDIETIVERENIFLPPKLNKVVVFYGVRRSGKSYVLFDCFKRHKDSAVYVDFEDERLTDFGVKDFQRLKEAFLELKPHLLGKEIFLLFDEVQTVRGWESFSRRAVERENIKVFLTGSSSKMMPQEFHTSLRGRTWSIELLPFSFREYLRFKGVDPKDKSVVYGRNKPLLKKYFSEYLKWGGFPEVALSISEFEKRKLIKEYLEAMFFKDLVERFDISNIHLLDSLKEKVFSSFSLKLSLTAFYRQYKDKFPFSKDSLFLYYKHFLDSMLAFEVRKFSESSYKRLRNPAKIYLVDTGIARRATSADAGRLLENIVFLELRRRGAEIFYFEEKRECDFIIKNNNTNFSAYQVVWELNEENESREINGLIEACGSLGIKKGIILTSDEEGKRKKGNVEIEIIPVWKWLLK